MPRRTDSAGSGAFELPANSILITLDSSDNEEEDSGDETPKGADAKEGKKDPEKVAVEPLTGVSDLSLIHI